MYKKLLLSTFEIIKYQLFYNLNKWLEINRMKKLMSKSKVVECYSEGALKQSRQLCFWKSICRWSSQS